MDKVTVFSIKYIESKGIEEVQGEIEWRGKNVKMEFLIFERPHWGSPRTLRVGRECFHTRDEAVIAGTKKLQQSKDYLERRLRIIAERMVSVQTLKLIPADTVVAASDHRL